jgi:hypothetical protein
MKHWSLSLLALAFFGAMVLSHIPRGLSALDDRRINGIAQLNLDTKVPASLSPIGDNVIEVDGIQLETLVPERVLTIPINERSVYTPVRFGVRITNKTLMPVYFSWGSFKPELIRLNGEVIPLGLLQISIVLLREFDFPLVMPQENVTLFWEGKLYWGNNELQLQLPDRYSRLWYFQGFQPGIYKIRFTYSFSSADASRGYYDSQSRELRQLQRVLTGTLSSPWAEFNLGMP